MGKLMFLPISIGSGLLAGLIGKKAFQLIWGVIDDEEAPKAEHRQISLPKLARRARDRGRVVRPDQRARRPRLAPGVRACHGVVAGRGATRAGVRASAARL